MFIDYYSELCERINKTESAVARESGVGKSTVTRWRQGSKPQAASLHKLQKYFSNFFDISLDDLKNHVTEKEPAVADSSKAVIDALYDVATPEQRELFVRLAEAILRGE